ncbi:hypothetical protein ACJX0J_015525, partial [Zea mays]
MALVIFFPMLAVEGTPDTTNNAPFTIEIKSSIINDFVIHLIFETFEQEIDVDLAIIQDKIYLLPNYDHLNGIHVASFYMLGGYISLHLIARGVGGFWEFSLY